MARGTGSEAAKAIAEGLRPAAGEGDPALVLLFASTAQPLGEVLPGVAAAFPGSVVLGSSTAGEFTEAGGAKGTAVAIAVRGNFRVFAGAGHGLSASPERAVEQALEGLPREVNGYPHRTAILLLDPLAGNGEEVTLLAAALLGGQVRLVGGAAGDDLHMERTQVGLGAHTASDAIVLALLFSKSPLGVGVCHGHEAISEPFTVTRAEGSVVFEIDHKPAWQVWLDATRARAAERGIDVDRLPKELETAFLVQYEAGLATGRELKIRAPLSRTEAGAIQFASGVPEGTVFRITEGTAPRQVESAREAARRAKAQLSERPACAIVFDCICRDLILGEGFTDAVAAIGQELGSVPLAGFETYGEIALDVGDLSGFHNTTSVVLLFPEE